MATVILLVTLYILKTGLYIVLNIMRLVKVHIV